MHIDKKGDHCVLPDLHSERQPSFSCWDWDVLAQEALVFQMHQSEVSPEQKKINYSGETRPVTDWFQQCRSKIFSCIKLSSCRKLRQICVTSKLRIKSSTIWIPSHLNSDSYIRPIGILLLILYCWSWLGSNFDPFLIKIDHF